MTEMTRTRSQQYLELAMVFQLPEDHSSELAQAYTRLFLGPHKPLVYPYESVYIEGQLGGITCDQVKRCYAEAGLKLSTNQHQLPDHISVELAFMAYLAAQEEQDTDQAQAWRQKQRRFLLDHLARWLPTFWQKIENSRAHPYYREAARSLRIRVEGDLKRSSSKGRYPNISLLVDTQRCTLCTLCKDSCRPGAISIESTRTELTLLFNRADCNGCRACLRLCPEGAIDLKRGQPLDQPCRSQPRSIAAAPRVICPKCNQPHIAVPWLKQLTQRLEDGKFATQSLIYCPPCKSCLEVGPGHTVSPVQEELVSV
ncbi:MAG TPA: molecular chaperone TorD family protein [Anaerolineales bacterium]|nr:molecular chaperone TorD family protein [Anaerolineales bacterium]